MKRLKQVKKREPEEVTLDIEFPYDDELTDEDFAMADVHAIKDILLLDPNDIEFRQRHAETDLAA